MQLCAQAAVEQDPEKLLVLVREINRLLEEKEQRLKSSGNQPLETKATSLDADAPANLASAMDAFTTVPCSSD